MNDAIISQILLNPPNVTHITGDQNALLEKLYHASLVVDPIFGETKVDDNANIADIYKLLNDFFKNKELDLELKYNNNILQPEYSYNAGIYASFIDLSPMSKLKIKDKTSYYILLHCISLVSKYCFNSVHYHDLWKENNEEMLLNCEKGEQDEIEYYMTILSQLDMRNGYETDYKRINNNNSVLILKNIFSNNKYKCNINIPPSIKCIVYEILIKYELWGSITRYIKSDESNYDQIYFTQYCGFKIHGECEIYNELIYNHLQYYYENDFIMDRIYFTEENIQNVDNIKGAINSLYTIIEAIEQILNEV